MKKLLSGIIISLFLTASTFAFNMSVGARAMLGGNVGNVDSDLNGFVSGSGLYVNLDFINGFGIQPELNFVSSTISTGSNSITFKPCEIIDIPLLLWYNNKINNTLIVGGGAGINFSAYSDSQYVTNNNSTINIGAAIGANLKICFTERFRLVLGTNAIFDFMPTQKITGENKEVTYIFGTEDKSRKAIYGTIGVEFKIF